MITTGTCLGLIPYLILAFLVLAVIYIILAILEDIINMIRRLFNKL